jgi:hypothetical protein
MVTFNVDSLDFVDDETAQFGADPDFDLGFDSANTRLELDDLTNAATSYVPQGRSGDLVDGRFSETVDEGKILTDDGEVYDDLQTAFDVASSWVKIGPGTFYSQESNNRFVVGSANMTVVGSGRQTQIIANSEFNALELTQPNQTLLNLRVQNTNSNANTTIYSPGGETHIENVWVEDSGGDAIRLSSSDCKVIDCHFENCGAIRANSDRAVLANNVAIDLPSYAYRSTGSDEAVIVGNQAINVGVDGVFADGNDCIIGANRIVSPGDEGIENKGADCIIYNNRINDPGGQYIFDAGSGTILDANITI